MLERGAVEGKVFHAGAVTTLSPNAAQPNVRSRLLALARVQAQEGRTLAHPLNRALQLNAWLVLYRHLFDEENRS